MIVFFTKSINFLLRWCIYISRIVFIPKEIRKFIKHNNKKWNQWGTNKSSTEILFEPFGIPEFLIANSYFVNVLAKKHNSKILSFSENRFSKPFFNKILKSFNCNNHIKIKLNKQQIIQRDFLSARALEEVKDKKGLYELKISGIWLGIDIYESYLRGGKATLNLKDPFFLETLNKGLAYFVFWTDYFKTHPVVAIIVSHDCYLRNVLVKIAYKNNIAVYLPNPRGISLSTAPFSITKNIFSNYTEYFKKLSLKKQKEAISFAKGMLEKRLSGQVGVDMSYSTKSAYTPVSNKQPVLQINDKIKIVICTHCFYDNPHAYGEMLFLDFYEWLSFLGEISEKTDYDWYVKTHPDYRQGTLEVIEGIIKKFPKIKLIPPETSFFQLADEGVSFALTCYGSIGHELPMLGIQVINAGYNPHSAYDFNWHAYSVDEYQNLLVNLSSLKKKINYNKIYEFYYIHFYYTYSDSLVYRSHRKMIKILTSEQQLGSKPGAYIYFLDQLTSDKHLNIIDSMQKYLESGKQYFFDNAAE